MYRAPTVVCKERHENNRISLMIFMRVDDQIIHYWTLTLPTEVCITKNGWWHCLITLSEIRDVSFKDRSLELPELTKLQKEIKKMVGLM